MAVRGSFTLRRTWTGGTCAPLTFDGRRAKGARPVALTLEEMMDRAETLGVVADNNWVELCLLRVRGVVTPNTDMLMANGGSKLEPGMTVDSL